MWASTREAEGKMERRSWNQELIHKAESIGPNDQMVVENEGETEDKNDFKASSLNPDG